MWRVAIYTREAPGRADRHRLGRQVAGLADLVARQPAWQHVATYGDLEGGPAAPGPDSLDCSPMHPSLRRPRGRRLWLPVG